MNIIPLILEAEIKRYKSELHDCLFAVIFSDSMKRIDPKVSDIRNLNLSVMSKCIVFLTHEGFETREIASLLLSNQHSIRTIMLNIKKRYPIPQNS